jgi:hypothetical protein
MKLERVATFAAARRAKQSRGNQREAKQRKPVVAVEPTPEQLDMNDWRGAGMAFQKVAVIDKLLEDNLIARKHYDALWYYRQQAHKAEDDAAGHSPSSPERMMSSGTGVAVTGTIPKGLLFTPAQNETHRIEADLGDLLHITRAIAVDDMTLSRWAIHTSGGREKLQGKGVVIVPRWDGAVQYALLELKFAAGRISY